MFDLLEDVVLRGKKRETKWFYSDLGAGNVDQISKEEGSDHRGRNGIRGDEQWVSENLGRGIGWLSASDCSFLDDTEV